MKKYLDPKADLTFKKVFGEHKDLVISFLNAMLPFGSEEEKIVSVEYLNPELVPVNPLRKDNSGCPVQGCPRPAVHSGDADDVDARIQAAGAVQCIKGIRQPVRKKPALRVASACLSTIR